MLRTAVLKGELGGETHVFSVPEVMSSVTRMMHLWPFTVDFQESWKRTMFGCCRPFSISTSSLKRCRSALVSLRVCRETSHCYEYVCMRRSLYFHHVLHIYMNHENLDYSAPCINYSNIIKLNQTKLFVFALNNQCWQISINIFHDDGRNMPMW